MEKSLAEIKEETYQGIIGKIDLVTGDVEMEVLIRDTLDELLPRVVIASIWKNMSDEEAKAFEDYKVSPTMPQDDALCSFAFRYESLAQKVSEDLERFVKKFVEDLNSA